MFYKALIALSLMLAIWPSLVLAEPKPLQPNTVPYKLTAEQAQQLRQAWEQDGMPTIEVVIGQQQDDELVNSNTPLQLMLRTAILEQLRLGVDAGRLVDTSSLRMQQIQDLRSIAAQRGQGIAETLATAMRSTHASGLVIMVRLQPVENGVFSVTMDTVDPAMASAVASKAFRNIRADVPVSRVNAYACSIVTHFLEQYASRVLRPGGALYTYRLSILGVNNDEDAGTIAAALRKTQGVVGRVEYDWEYLQGGIGFGRYTVSTRESDSLMLVRGFRRSVRDEMPGKAFFSSRSSRGSMIGSILELKTPRWWMTTDFENHSRVVEARQKREAALGISRRLRVAVVIGPDLESPAAMVEDRSVNLRREFDDSVLKSELESMLRRVGFDAVDDISLKDARDLAQAQMSRFTNLENLALAAQDKHRFEYLLYGNLSSTKDGKRYEFRLIDRQSGTVVGTQRWPDARVYNNDPQYHVRADDSSSVARYVVGQVVDQLDARLLDKRLVMEVVVKNVRDIAHIAMLADLFKQVPGVQNVGTYNYSMPIRGFEIVYEGSDDSLMQALHTELHKLDLPMVVDAFGDRQLAVNLLRKPIAQTKPTRTTRVDVPDRKPTSQPSSTTPSATQEPSTSAQVSPRMLQKHLLAARESVCAIGFEASGAQFIPIGTGWTVGPGMIATNAHVVEGLNKTLSSNPNLRAVARRGQQLDVVMGLGAMRIHPGYVAWNAWQHQFKGADLVSPFDVAVIEVTTNNAGTPLKLADTSRMDAILPGDPVGYVGFPMEGKANVNAKPALMTDTSTVSAYTDVFFQSRKNAMPGILHYSLVTRGGASGSPVIAEDGTVIAVHSSGDSASITSIQRLSRYWRQVVSSDGERIEKKGKPVLAQLSQPGLPVQRSKNNYVVRTSDGVERRFIQGLERIIDVFSHNELLIDPNGVVTGVLMEQPRVRTGFSYGQSVEMLKELLDGTAEAKQKVRTQQWREQANQLSIMD